LEQHKAATKVVELAKVKKYVEGARKIEE